MGMSTDTIRRITIKGEGQYSLDSLASSVDRVKAAQDQLNRATLTAAAAQERATAATAAAAAIQERFAKAGDTSAIAQERIAKAQDKATRAAEEVVAAQNGVTAAQNRLTQASSNTATVTDIASRKTLSAAEAYRRQTLAVVDGARQQDQLARATRVVDSALKQGIITTEQHAARVSLLKEKYGEASISARGMAAASSLLSQAMSPLMAMLSAGAILSFATARFKEAASLAEEAEQIHATTDALQAYRAAFLTNGVAAEQGATAIQRYSRTVGEAKDAAGPARQAFAELGITMADLSAPDGGLSRTAMALLGVKDANERARLEVELLGRSGMNLEPVLQSLANPLDVLIARAKEAGLVVEEGLAKKADAASDRMAVAWAKLNVTVTPAIVAMMDAVGGLVDNLDRLASFKASGLAELLLRLDPQNQAYLLYNGGTSKGLVNGSQVQESTTVLPAPNNSSQNVPGYWYSLSGGSPASAAQQSVFTPSEVKEFLSGSPTSATGFGGSTPNTNKFFSSQDLQASMAGLSPVGKSQRQADIDLANAKIKDGSAILKDQNGLVQTEVRSWGDVLQVTTATERAHAESNARIITQGAAAEKIKITFKGYLDQLGEEARLAGLTTEDRSEQEAIIQGSIIHQKARNVAEKDINRTFQFATGELGKQNVAAVEFEVTQKRINALAARFSEQAHSALKDYQDAVLAIDQNVSKGAYSAQEGDVQKAGLPLNQQRLSAQSQMDQSNPFGADADIAVSAQKETAANSRDSSLAANDNWRKSGLESEQTYADMKVAINQDYADRVRQIETSLASARLQIGETSFGQMADALSGLVGKTSDAYKVMFGISKAFAIADAMIQLPAAMMKALDTPFPANLAAIATVASLGASIISNIVSVASPQGYATGVVGLDGPGTGTSDSILIKASRGESVITAAGTDRNPRTLAAINAGASFDQVANDRGGGNVVNFSVSVDARGAQEGVGDQLDRKLNALVPDLAKKIIAITDSRSGTNTAAAARHPRRR